MGVSPICQSQMLKNFDSSLSIICTNCLDTQNQTFNLCKRNYQNKFCNFKEHIIVENKKIVAEVTKCLVCDIIVPHRTLMVCGGLIKDENCFCKKFSPHFDDFLCSHHVNQKILFEEKPCQWEEAGNAFYCNNCLVIVSKHALEKLNKSNTIITCRNSPYVTSYFQYYELKLKEYQSQMDAINRLVLIYEYICIYR